MSVVSPAPAPAAEGQFAVQMAPPFFSPSTASIGQPQPPAPPQPYGGIFGPAGAIRGPATSRTATATPSRSATATARHSQSHQRTIPSKVAAKIGPVLLCTLVTGLNSLMIILGVKVYEHCPGAGSFLNAGFMILGILGIILSLVIFGACTVPEEGPYRTYFILLSWLVGLTTLGLYVWMTWTLILTPRFIFGGQSSFSNSVFGDDDLNFRPNCHRSLPPFANILVGFIWAFAIFSALYFWLCRSLKLCSGRNASRTRAHTSASAHHQTAGRGHQSHSRR